LGEKIVIENMRASKEQAKKAQDALAAIRKTALGKFADAHFEEFELVARFLVAAERKLPREKAFAKDRAKARHAPVKGTAP
jgi:hypothetical protein